MRKRRHIFPLLFMHICIVFHSPVYVYAFSFGLVFLPSSSFHKNALTPKISKKTHFTGKEKEPPAIVILLLSFGTFLLCDTHAHARLVSLFDINERAIAFILSRLSLDRRVRVLVFNARKELERLFAPLSLSRARPKKVQNSLVCCVILLFL